MHYFGVETAIKFAWMHAVYRYLLIPMCGLSLLLTLCLQPYIEATNKHSWMLMSVVVVLAYSMMSMVFLVWWKQVTSLLLPHIYTPLSNIRIPFCLYCSDCSDIIT